MRYATKSSVCFLLLVLSCGLSIRDGAIGYASRSRTSAWKHDYNSAFQGNSSARIPLCAGLTIVTAISQQTGDYESIKTIQSVNDQEVRLKYSSERMSSDFLSDDKPTLQQTVTYRTIRSEDLTNAKLYEQQFYDKLPELIPGTTAIGTSAAVLNSLKTKGEAEIGIFIAFTGKPSIDREVHPNVFDNQMVAKIHRVEPGDVMIPLIVNNVLTPLPAIHAEGDFFGDQTDFFFLDDPTNPIALKWRFGIGALADDAAEIARNSGARVSPDRETLEVVKITYRCGDAQLVSQANGGGNAAQPPAAGNNSDPGQLERTLAASGTAAVYDIYFSFNSDQIREESEPRLKEIADVFTKHPDWKLGVEGHTDNIGSNNYNLDLSRRRSAAVKDALVKRYRIDPARLTTSGFGASRPQDTNETLEGRARNRRVELVRH